MHSKLPEGCGQTIHCKSCTIRNSVMDTLNTGISHTNVPAYLDKSLSKKTKYLITTEKAGDAVLLRIDELSDEKNSF